MFALVRHTARRGMRMVTPHSRPLHGTAPNSPSPSLHNFFAPSAVVRAKREFNRTRGQLHFIFLEGLPGTGKQSVLWRLNKMGFKIHSQPYLQYCATNAHVHALATHESDPFSARGSVTALHWLTTLAHALDQHQQQYRPQLAPAQYPHHVLIVHRSPLSPALHGHATPLAAQLHAHWCPSLLWCHSDPIRRSERLAERNADPEAPLQHIRAQFRELDEQHLHEQSARLQALYETPLAHASSTAALGTHWFDFVLPTTDTKQATAQILTSCGFEFQNVFTNPFKQ